MDVASYVNGLLELTKVNSVVTIVTVNMVAIKRRRAEAGLSCHNFLQTEVHETGQKYI